jgi:hypothetical protein
MDKSICQRAYIAAQLLIKTLENNVVPIKVVAPKEKITKITQYG